MVRRIKEYKRSMKLKGTILSVLIAIFFIIAGCGNPLSEVIQEDEQRHLDIIPPVITVFTLTSEDPATSKDITFTLAGNDDVSGIDGWLINETATKPDPDAGGWVIEIPTGYQLSEGDGNKTVYAWAKDGAGNVSDSLSFTLILYTSGPTISFTLTSTTPTSNPSITFNITGEAEVTGWYINENNANPDPGDPGWTGTAPSDYTFSPVPGIRTLYAWGKNAGDLLSVRKSIQIDLSVTPPTPSIASGSLITGHEVIVLTFSETMDPASDSFGGTIGVATDTWSAGTHTNDTLSINPDSLWGAGNGKTLTVDCNNQYGVPITTLNLSYDVFNGTCVDDDLGAPTNDGSVTKPFDTIQAGINEADATYVAPANGIDTAEVRVAGGEYTGDGPLVTMKDGVAVYGGYSSNFVTQDSVLYESTIRDTRTTGGSWLNPGATIFSDIAFSVSTELAYFTIEMIDGAGNTGSGIRCANAGPDFVIRNNIIQAYLGDGLPDNAYGIYLNTCGGMTIRDNSIDPGSSTGHTYGIQSIDSSPTIESNSIYGGTAGTDGAGDTSYAIRCSVSDPVIHDNSTIDAGFSTLGYSYGIYVVQCSPDIDNNTFRKQTGNNATTFLYEFDGTSEPSAFSNNYFAWQNGYWYSDEGGTTNVTFNIFTTTSITVNDVLDSLDTWGNDGVGAQ